MREEKAKPVIGNLCLTRSICFSCFDPEKSLFHTIADNSNEFLNFDGWPNAFNRRYRALQNKSTLAEVFPENKALFHKSCIAAYNKQSWKQKLKENENGDRSGSCNMNLKIKKRAKKKKSLEFRKTLKECCFCCKRDQPKNLHKCQMLKLHTRVKNAAQNLNDFNLVAKLSDEEMRESDTKYSLNCLTSLYRREKKKSYPLWRWRDHERYTSF